MSLGMPAYPTLMELRAAGWTLEEISVTYGVQEPEIRRALAQHFRCGDVGTRSSEQSI